MLPDFLASRTVILVFGWDVDKALGLYESKHSLLMGPVNSVILT